jgi:hypothetical protein
MGRQELVTAPALRDVQDMVSTARRVAADPSPSSGTRALLRVQADSAEASTRFAHARARAADVAMHMVFGERTIAEAAAKARLPIRLLDGIEPLDAA